MFIDFLLGVFNEAPESDAIVWRDKSFTYEWLTGRVAFWSAELERRSVKRGEVISIEADFSPNAVALLWR